MTCGEELLALLIPLHEDFMLLPNAAVAEVIGYREAEPLAHTPDWLAGEIQWRREPTPVIRFERLAGLPAGPPGHRARICMVNTLTPESRIPYFGVIAQGIPRLVRIGGGNTEPLARDGVGGGDQAMAAGRRRGGDGPRSRCHRKTAAGERRRTRRLTP
ncbi:MAG TPA: chemotaxis protein CheW [Chromatiales bacterium]|nr:chemotaxis protein CheW [Chromatiales bacterium]